MLHTEGAPPSAKKRLRPPPDTAALSRIDWSNRFNKRCSPMRRKIWAWALAFLLFAPAPWATIALLKQEALPEPYAKLPAPFITASWRNGFAGHFPLVLHLALLLDPRVKQIELDRTVERQNH